MAANIPATRKPPSSGWVNFLTISTKTALALGKSGGITGLPPTIADVAQTGRHTRHMQAGFSQRCFTGTSVPHERDVANVFQFQGCVLLFVVIVPSQIDGTM